MPKQAGPRGRKSGTNSVASSNGADLEKRGKRRRTSTDVGGPTDDADPSRDQMIAALAKVGVDVGGCSLSHVQLSTLYRKNANPSKARKPNTQPLEDEIDDIRARNGRLRRHPKPSGRQRPSVFSCLSIPTLPREGSTSSASQLVVDQKDAQDDDGQNEMGSPAPKEDAARVLKQWCESDPFGDHTVDSRLSRSPETSNQIDALQSPHTSSSSQNNPSSQAGLDSERDGPPNGPSKPSSNLTTGAAVTRALNSPTASRNQHNDRNFLRQNSQSSSDEEAHPLGPILDHRLRPRDVHSRRVSKTHRASTSKTASQKTQQSSTRNASRVTHPTDDESEGNDDRVVALRRLRPRKSQVFGSAKLDPRNETDAQEESGAPPRGRGQRQGSDRARGSSCGRFQGRGSGNIQIDGRNPATQKTSKPSRFKITPRQGNRLQLRVPSPKIQQKRQDASRPLSAAKDVSNQSSLQKRNKKIVDSDEEDQLDDPRDDDYQPDLDLEQHDDEDEEMNQPDPHESHTQLTHPKQVGQQTHSNRTSRQDSTGHFGGDSSNTRQKGKGRAVNQDRVSEGEEENLRAQEKEADILRNWNDHDLLGNASTSARPASPSITDPLEFSDDQPSSQPSGSRARQEMRILRKHVSSINAATATNSSDIRRLNSQMNVFNDLLKRISCRCKCGSDAPTSTRSRQVSDDEGESEDNSPSPRTSPERRYIRRLVRVLLGLKADDKESPHGASPAEKRNWKTNTTMPGLLVEAPINLGQSESRPIMSSLEVTDESPGSIKIIRDTLYHAGVEKFRPDWSEAMGSTNNAHLCRVAAVIFIKLVRSGEYSGVSKNFAEPAKIYPLILSHLNDTWRRKFRESREWSQSRLKERHKTRVQNNRIVNVREGRSNYVMGRSHLWPLTPIIQACCSDDETDSEADPVPGKKFCKVRRLPWRNPRLEKIFDDIDAVREKNNHVKASPGNQPRIRQRNPNYPMSKKSPPKGLNIDCYCPLWLDQVAGRREVLEVVEVPILDSIKRALAKYIAQES